MAAGVAGVGAGVGGVAAVVGVGKVGGGSLGVEVGVGVRVEKAGIAEATVIAQAADIVNRVQAVVHLFL